MSPGHYRMWKTEHVACAMLLHIGHHSAQHAWQVFNLLDVWSQGSNKGISGSCRFEVVHTAGIHHIHSLVAVKAINSRCKSTHITSHSNGLNRTTGNCRWGCIAVGTVQTLSSSEDQGVTKLLHFYDIQQASIHLSSLNFCTDPEARTRVHTEG
jgi:hypothetical protein